MGVCRLNNAKGLLTVAKSQNKARSHRVLFE